VLPVAWTSQSKRDYREIIEYLDEHSPKAADRFADAIALKTRLLSTSPRMGRARNELHPGVRSIVVGKYLIFYRIGSTAVEILRILYGGRDLSSIDFQSDDP
jgi:toxin ParE1/3/4